MQSAWGFGRLPLGFVAAVHLAGGYAILSFLTHGSSRFNCDARRAFLSNPHGQRGRNEA
jgi:hypothetical protein